MLRQKGPHTDFKTGVGRRRRKRWRRRCPKNKILCLLHSPAAGVLLSWVPVFRPHVLNAMSEKCRFPPRGLSLDPSPIKMAALPISQFAPTSSSRGVAAKRVSHLLVLEDFQEERGEEFVGTLHLHVEEAAGVARPDHPQVRHLHQELGPEVRNVVLAVVDVVLKRQQVGLLALLDFVHAGQARPVWCGGGEEREEEIINKVSMTNRKIWVHSSSSSSCCARTNRTSTPT